MREIQGSLSQLVQEKYEEIIKFREKYLEAWVAETGLHPSECELVEETSEDRLRTTIYVRKRSKNNQQSNMR